MSDELRAILLSIVGGEATLDGLFAWCCSRGLQAEVQLISPSGSADDAYEAALREPHGSRWWNCGNGFGPSGFAALGHAIVRYAEPWSLCPNCMGYPDRWGGKDGCMACGGSGLAKQRRSA